MKIQIPFFALTLALLFGAGGMLHSEEGSRNISGVLFEDENGDGVYNEGERIGGKAKIYLVRVSDGEVIDEVEADEFGQYLFKNVPYGEYRLIIEFPWNLTVETEPFNLGPGDGDFFFPIPLLTDDLMPRFSSFSVVNTMANPANVNQPDVSPSMPVCNP